MLGRWFSIPRLKTELECSPVKHQKGIHINSLSTDCGIRGLNFGVSSRRSIFLPPVRFEHWRKELPYQWFCSLSSDVSILIGWVSGCIGVVWSSPFCCLSVLPVLSAYTIYTSCIYIIHHALPNLYSLLIFAFLIFVPYLHKVFIPLSIRVYPLSRKSHYFLNLH